MSRREIARAALGFCLAICLEPIIVAQATVRVNKLDLLAEVPASESTPEVSQKTTQEVIGVPGSLLDEYRRLRALLHDYPERDPNRTDEPSSLLREYRWLSDEYRWLLDEYPKWDPNETDQLSKLLAEHRRLLRVYRSVLDGYLKEDPSGTDDPNGVWVEYRGMLNNNRSSLDEYLKRAPNGTQPPPSPPPPNPEQPITQTPSPTPRQPITKTPPPTSRQPITQTSPPTPRQPITQTSPPTPRQPITQTPPPTPRQPITQTSTSPPTSTAPTSTAPTSAAPTWWIVVAVGIVGVGGVSVYRMLHPKVKVYLKTTSHMRISEQAVILDKPLDISILENKIRLQPCKPKGNQLVTNSVPLFSSMPNVSIQLTSKSTVSELMVLSESDSQHNATR